MEGQYTIAASAASQPADIRYPAPATNPAHRRDVENGLLRLQISHLEHELEVARTQARDTEIALDESRQQLLAYAHDLAANYAAGQRALERERRAHERLETAHLDTLMRLVHGAAFRDQETGAHIRRIGLYSGLLARELGLTLEAADRIGKAAPMHDVGKLGVPDRILHKPGLLTPEEWVAMKRHCEIGGHLLTGSPSKLIQTAEIIALHHHERYDGSGYPKGLAGDAIPLEARIVAVVDVYDALRSPRAYKPAYSHHDALDVILRGDGRTLPDHFDRHILETFRRVEQQFALIYERHHDLAPKTYGE